MSKIVTTEISRPYFNIKIDHREHNVADEAVIHEMFTENIYHLESYKLSQDQPIVLDVGANIGTFTMQTLAVAQENNIVVKVYAIEPEENNLKLLRKNLEQNPRLFENGSSVEIIETAISGFNGKASITNDAGGSRVCEEIDSKLQVIDVITYDHLIEQLKLDKIDFVKIDIEGSEVGLITNISKDNLLKTHFYVVECDRFNGKDAFISMLKPFLNDFSFETWGIPAQGCNLYLENHHWE
jgi:FkbM family methyltransferase